MLKHWTVRDVVYAQWWIKQWSGPRSLASNSRTHLVALTLASKWPDLSLGLEEIWSWPWLEALFLMRSVLYSFLAQLMPHSCVRAVTLTLQQLMIRQFLSSCCLVLYSFWCINRMWWLGSSKTSFELEDISRTNFGSLSLGLGLKQVWPWRRCSRTHPWIKYV